MPTIAEVRQKYPQYADMPDEQLADALHRKFYSDMPKAEFLAKIGVVEPPAPKPAFSGAILPFSKDTEGNVSFDSNAGVVGMAKSLFGAVKGGTEAVGDTLRGHPVTEETVDRVVPLGALATPVNPALRSGDMAIPGAARAMRKPDISPPTMQELHKAGSAGYKSAKEMGVDFHPEAVRDMARTAQAELFDEGTLRDLAPTTHKILDELANPPAAGPDERAIVQLSSLIAARKALRKAGLDWTKPEEKNAANRVLVLLHKFIEEPDPASVMAGPAAAAGKVVNEGRRNKAAAHRSEKLTHIGEKAELNAAVSHSGQNLDNAIRQRARDILDPDRPERRAGYSKFEIQLIEKVAKGNPGRNTLRFVGNLLGGGGGLGAMVAGGIGGFAGGGAPGLAIGAAVPATGFALKKAANKLTTGALRNADEAVRKRSPEYERMLAEAPAVPMSTAKRSALLKSLTAGFASQPATPEEAAKRSLIYELLGQP